MSDKPAVGSIGWIDLTIPEAEEVRDFYQAVTGWESQALSMGDYSDFVMQPPGGAPVGGICHARGTNKGLPAAWLIYIVVEDLEASMESCRKNGGKILAGPKEAGGQGRYCVFEDPAGAVAALYQAL